MICVLLCRTVPLRVRFDELRDELRVWQQKKRDATEKVRTLLNQNQDALAPLKDLIEEREALRREIALHRQEVIIFSTLLRCDACVVE